MKLKLTITTLFGFFVLTASAQVPNNSFENWNSVNIENWISTNGLILLGNGQSVYQSTDAHTGTYACELIATQVTNKPPVYVPDYVASIFIGKQVGFTSVMGYPYTEKPSKFEFWYKCVPLANDTATAIVALTRWNPQASKRDTVAWGFFFQATVDSATYKKGEITLNYLSAETPDTACILFSAVTPNCTQGGSKFLIDDVAFTGGTVGINDVLENSFNVYPNPAANQVQVQFSQTQTSGSLVLYSIVGREILSFPLNAVSEFSFPVSGLENGIYFLKINHKEGAFTQRIEISH